MKRQKLIWDPWNREHIKKHKVTVEEAEEAYKAMFAETDSYDNRKTYLGKTKKGRLLTISVSFKRQKGPYVVSARDMSKKERRLYL